MKPKKPKPLTHAEFSARGGKAGTPAQNAARAQNGKKGGRKKKLETFTFTSSGTQTIALNENIKGVLLEPTTEDRTILIKSHRNIETK